MSEMMRKPMKTTTGRSRTGPPTGRPIDGHRRVSFASASVSVAFFLRRRATDSLSLSLSLSLYKPHPPTPPTPAGTHLILVPCDVEKQKEDEEDEDDDDDEEVRLLLSVAVIGRCCRFAKSTLSIDYRFFLWPWIGASQIGPILFFRFFFWLSFECISKRTQIRSIHEDLFAKGLV